MADRKLPTSLSPGPVTGPDYMDAVAAKVGMLFDSMALKPTSVVNSANDYTITVDPVLDADVVAGMGFFIQPSATNTGPCRLRVGATNPYYDLVKAGGEALAAGDFSAGTAYYVVFLGGEFRILSVASNESGGGANIDFQQFDVSGNWTKPEGLSAEAIVFVEVWGAGGGGGLGASGGGFGGGGSYNYKILRAADVTSVVSVSVGAGGIGGTGSTNGGNSSFGSYVVAYGGGGGGQGTSSGGGGGGHGGGGGMFGAGGHGGNANGTTPGANGGGGAGGGRSAGTGSSDGWDFGGGAGAANNFANYGGGGGGIGTVGGLSNFGGNGGGTNTAGEVPGGGGGRGQPGGAGRVKVRVIG